ncbi:MAG: hemolysin III family protein [Traorella sp.]
MKSGSMKNLIQLSFKEEVGNSISHGVMAVICLFLLPICAVKGYIDGGIIQSIALSIFILSLFLMFLISCLYHSMKYETGQKTVFRILDHCFIYVAIAGSYTPVALCIIEGWQGALILILQWSMVLAGVLYKSIAQKAYPKLSVTIYLVMGWAAILFIPLLLKKASLPFMFFIVLGGLFYSIGTFFYKKQYDYKYFHLIWHFFINAGAIAHMIGIIFFI